jgi:uncharacterized protein with FMN-binding domain
VRARAAVGGVLTAFGILAGAWEYGVLSATDTTTSTTDVSGSTTTGTDTSTTTDTSTATDTSATDGTWTGSAVSTRWGDVQVQVTISGGAITDVVALQLTDKDNKSVQISNRAAPILREEVLAAQSADVSNVSGATYTTNAYLQSLQSALDQAGF